MNVRKRIFTTEDTEFHGGRKEKWVIMKDSGVKYQVCFIVNIYI